MTKLRQRMEEDMRIRNLAPTTKKRYLDRVAIFANYFNRSPALLGAEQARKFLLYLAQERKLSASSYTDPLRRWTPSQGVSIKA